MRHPSAEGEDARWPVVCNPAALWRRTSSSVVVLPPGGEPTELIGAAAAVWDAVSRPELGGRLVESVDASEVEQIIDAFTQLALVVAA